LKGFPHFKNEKGVPLVGGLPFNFFQRRNKIMYWTKLNFGKHKGKTLPQVILKDADWFFHAYKNSFFKGVLAQEADELYRRARSIRVPSINGEKMLVEYTIHREGRSGRVKFGTMQLIADGSGLENLKVAPSIDFYVPRLYAPYDKTGYRNFVVALKTILFGNPSHRMNRKACEDFFNCDDNFDLN
jgi:hypothetical protein